MKKQNILRLLYLSSVTIFFYISLFSTSPFLSTFTSASFFNIFSAIPDKSSVITFYAPSIQTNGRLKLTLRTSAGNPLIATINNVILDVAWSPYLSTHTNLLQEDNLTDIQNSLTSNNFIITDTKTVTRTIIFASPDEIKEWLKSWLPFLIYIPIDQQDLFLDSIINQYQIDYPDFLAKDSIQVPTSQLILCTQKVASLLL